MISKSNRAFSLVEVLITVAILSSAIVFIFRGFTAMLSSAKFSQNITHACLLAEDKLWEIEQRWNDDTSPLESDGTQTIEGREFKWNYSIEESDLENLKKLRLTLAWKEKAREKDYTLEFLTYLAPKK